MCEVKLKNRLRGIAMRIRNAFKVLFSNINYLYKSTFYRLLCTAVAVLIAYFAVRPGLLPVLEAEEFTAFWQNLRNIPACFFKGEGVKSATDALPASFSAFTAMLKNNVYAIKWAAIGAIIVIYVWRALLAAGDYTFGRIFNEHMSSYTHFNFLPTLIVSAGSAFSYGALIALIELVSGAIILGVAAVIAVYLIEYLSVLAIILGILLLVFGFSLRFALFSRVMPNMVCEGDNFFVALKKTFPSGRSLMPLTGNYAFMLIFLYYVNVSVALFTFLIGLIVAIPFSALAITSLKMVEFYCYKGKRFYVDYETVVSPGKNRADAEFMKFM